MSNTTSTQLASMQTAEVVDHRTYRGLTMAMAPAEAGRRLEEFQAFVAKVMKPDHDFGVIPGTEKPTLFQSGAQKLAELYGFSHRFILAEAVKDWDRGFFYFEYRCELSSRSDGAFVGEGLGSCNSRESRYAGRWVPLSEVPPNLDAKRLQSRHGSRWVFRSELPSGIDVKALETQERVSRKNGSKYNVWKIVDEVFLVPNPDPYSLVNTLQKMAAKRAYIHAVIAATRSSAMFTQNVEDLPPEAFGQVEARAWDAREKGEPAATSPAPSAAAEAKTDDAPTTEVDAGRARAFLERVDAATTTEEMAIVMREIKASKLPKVYREGLRKPCRLALDRITAGAKKNAKPVPAPSSPAAAAPCPMCGEKFPPDDDGVSTVIDGKRVRIHPGCDPLDAGA